MSKAQIAIIPETDEDKERWYWATSCADPDCERCAYRRRLDGLPPLTTEQKAAMRDNEGKS